jgi:hypothetical protein
MHTTQQNVFFYIFNVSLSVYTRCVGRINCYSELLAEPGY